RVLFWGGDIIFHPLSVTPLMSTTKSYEGLSPRSSARAAERAASRTLRARAPRSDRGEGGRITGSAPPRLGPRPRPAKPPHYAPEKPVALGGRDAADRRTGLPGA